MGKEIKRYEATISGSRVQGVGLRMFTKEHAEKLGITGWIKNMPDGTVAAQLQGEEAKLTELIKTVKAGNFVINVDSFDYIVVPPVAGETAFIIKY